MVINDADTHYLCFFLDLRSSNHSLAMTHVCRFALRFDLLRRGKKRFTTDGLSSLKYQVKDIVLEKLYTRLLIELGRR